MLTWIMSFALLFWLVVAYLKPKLIDNGLFTASLVMIVSALIALFMFR